MAQRGDVLSDGEAAQGPLVAALRGDIEEDLKKPYKHLFDDSFEKVMPVDQPLPQKEEEAPFAQKKFYIAKTLLEGAKDAGAKTVVQVTFKEAEKGDAKAAPKRAKKAAA